MRKEEEKRKMTENSVGFCIFYDWLEVFELLDKEDVADLIFAIGKYYTDGTDIMESVSDRAKPVALMISKQLERAKQRKETTAPTVIKGRRLEEGIYKTETETETKTETETETKTETETETKTETETSSETEAKEKSREEAILGGGACDGEDFSFSSGLAGAPTLTEVEDYVRECGLKYVTARQFHEYNERRGWQIDGVPIRDWKSVIHIWDTKHRPPVTEQKEEKARYGNFDVNEAFNRALARSYGDLG